MLSIAIIARDEARHIGECLASLVGLGDEVLVLLDERTTDGTAQVCAEYGAKVQIEPWRGFPAQRNRALACCTHAWVLFIDADERVTPELAHEIRTLLAQPTAAGYWIPRYNLFFGRVVRGGGWYPDHQLRLVYRTTAHYDEQRLVHELVHIPGECGYLHHHLRHLNIERLAEFWLKQTRYALAEARTLHREGRRARWRNFIGGPAREFWHRYLQLGGWRDGPLGLFLCGALAWFELVKFAFLRGMDCRPTTQREA